MRWKLVSLLLSICWGWASEQQPSNPAESAARRTDITAVSLAELARQTRQQRSGAATPVRLITNAELLSINSNVSTGSTSPDRPATADLRTTETEKEAEASGLTGEGMAELRSQFEEARLKLMIITNEASVLQLRFNRLLNAFFTQSDGAAQERIQNQLADTRAQIEENKLAQAKARLTIRTLQQSAKKAGIPKGQIQKLTGELPEEPPEITG